MTDGPSFGRELRGDKGQTCETCGEHFKYQYLYNDHVPCRARALDPTTAAIEAQNIERDRLCAEVVRLTKIGDLMFEKGYDQAAREIRDHFKEAQMTDVVAEVEKIWMWRSS